MTFIEVELVGMANGGRAIGRTTDGQIIFVHGGITGESVQVEISEMRGRTTFAEIREFITVSDDRVQPMCPVAPSQCCGTWQHIAYDAQCLLKQDVLADQLDRVGKFSDADVAPILQPTIGSEIQWDYLHTWPMNPPFAVPPCARLHPALVAIGQALDVPADGWERAELRLGSDEAVMLLLKPLDEQAPEIELDLPLSVNLLLTEDEPMNLIGETHTRYHVNGKPFRVTAGARLRGHVAQWSILAQTVVAVAAFNPTWRVLHLNAGSGEIAVYVTQHVAHLTVAEPYPPATTDLETQLAELEHVDVVEGDAEDVLENWEDAFEGLIVETEPRGLSVEAIDLIVARGFQRVLLVAADPASAARDAGRLAKQGYQLTWAQAVDTAPNAHTFETLLRLDRVV